MTILVAIFALLGACGVPQPSTLSQTATSAVKPDETRAFAKKHAGGTLVVSFLPDGKRAISSGMDNTARLWMIPSGSKEKEYSGPQFHFQSIAISPDGGFALTPAPDGSVNYWNIQTGQMQRKFAGDPNGLGEVALSFDGRWAAAGGQSTAIYVWDVSSTAQSSAKRLEVDAAVLQVAFRPSNLGLYAVLRDGRLCEWSLDRAKALRCTTVLSEPVGQAAFSAHCVLVGGTYGTLVLWDLDRNSEVRKLEGTSRDIVALALAGSGKLALSGGADKTVRLWDLESGRQIASARATGDYVSTVAFSPGERSALFGSSDGSVALWQFK